VTAQLAIFANFRYAHVNYYTDQTVSFEHFFIKVNKPSSVQLCFPSPSRISSSVADPDPESSVFLTSGFVFGMEKFRIRDPVPS
jgi:hypothetical protein